LTAVHAAAALERHGDRLLSAFDPTAVLPRAAVEAAWLVHLFRQPTPVGPAVGVVDIVGKFRHAHDGAHGWGQWLHSSPSPS
jgi:hypothetical protein